MTTYVPADIRRIVVDRAGGRCEYCHIKESDTFCGCQIDHIISEKHSGQTIELNLAYTCAFCNRFKGSDIGSIAGSTGEFTRFYNPRIDLWAEHFEFIEFRIVPLTPIGETTAQILKFNELDRVLERQAIQDAECA